MHITAWNSNRDVHGEKGTVFERKKAHNLCWVISVINTVFRILFDSIFGLKIKLNIKIIYKKVWFD